MSKFWAMLRDSYREAVDGYIMFVMLILIGVVAILIGSLSAAPVPAGEALPQMVPVIGQTGQGLQAVTGDRGKANKQAYFALAQTASDVSAGDHPPGRPWEGTVTFVVTYQSVGGGAAGIEADADADGKLKPESIKKDSVITGDAFKEAVRYWAAKPGEKKPAFTDALAEEFVAAHMRDGTRLNVTKVTRVAKKPAGGGGVFGALLGGGPAPAVYEVTASGGERVGWAHKPSILFGVWNADIGVPLGELVYLVESTLLNRFGAWVILLAGVVVTAGFIPNMIRKGGIDLMISKPLSRPLILLYKYLGGLLFVFFLTAAAVGAVWLVIGVRTGVWSPAVWWCVPSITAYFAVLYACSTLIAVLTRNAIVSIVLTIVFWFALFVIGALITLTNVAEAQQDIRQAQVRQRQQAAQKDKQPSPPAEDEVAATVPEKSWWLWSLEALNRASPRINDLDELTRQQISADLQNKVKFEGGKQRDGLGWAEVAGVSGLWVAGLLGLATLRFVTRSY